MQNGLCENLIGPLLVLQTAAATEAYSSSSSSTFICCNLHVTK